MNKYNFGMTYIADDGRTVLEHKHECYELVLYETCSGITGIDGKKYEFAPGAVALIYPGTMHDEWHRSGGKLTYIGFDCDFEDLPHQGVMYTKGECVGQLMHGILAEVRLQKRNYDVMLAAMLSELMVELSRCVLQNEKTPRDISYVKNHIDENYGAKIDFTLAAASCGYSYSYLRHKFKALYGESPQNYLINVRLARARELLTEGSCNCTEACYRCGFSNCSQFTKMFKRRFGVLPKALQKNTEKGL